MSENKTSSGGIGFCGLLTIAFVVLKLCKVIAWSWWWVTCPIWAVFALVIMGALIYVPIKLWMSLREDKEIRQRRQNQIRRVKNDMNEEKEKADKNKGKSAWQIRVEEMQEAQKLREGVIIKGKHNGII